MLKNACKHERKSLLVSMVLANILLINSQVSAKQIGNQQTTNEQVTNQQNELPILTLEKTTVKAAKLELQQSPGLSIISEDAIAKKSIANDVSEIVRTMPGVNLSGSSTSGQRGNQRQIDLRGMGPDNTLILIDGRPVTSRHAIRLGRAGERDTRGDSQWIPPSAIERIEVLRGPAAARYGSGSMGGVVNIITKKPSKSASNSSDKKTAISVVTHYEQPQDDLQGADWRTGLTMSGMLSDKLSYRTALGYHNSEGDSPKINAKDAVVIKNRRGKLVPSVAAGREGVENIDGRILLQYEIDNKNTLGIETSFSNQSNHWQGDSQFQAVNPKLVKQFLNTTTNEINRYGLAVTLDNEFTDSDLTSYLEYNRTINKRLKEGLAGGAEGQIYAKDSKGYGRAETTYETLNAKSEWDMYFDKHTLTLGAEARSEKLDDKVNNQMRVLYKLPDTKIKPTERDSQTDAYLLGAYIEDNYEVMPNWYITPGLRYDYSSEAGNNIAPSLNTTWNFLPKWTMKIGASRAFKAPGLFQLNPNYIWYTRGNGCPADIRKLYAKNRTASNGCYVTGNPELKHETAINKEITIAYDSNIQSNDAKTNAVKSNATNDTKLSAGLTYFHNDYKNRIAAGYRDYTKLTNPIKGGDKVAYLYRWENQSDATIAGLEGFVNLTFDDVNWYSNVTSNIMSERKDNKEPLSLTPKYTLNSSLNWQMTQDWQAGLAVSHYGKIDAPKKSVTTGETLKTKRLSVSPYSIVNANTQYQATDNIKIGFGVKNLFNKQVNREGTSNNAGARTFNEPGRYYTVDVTLDY